MVLGHKDFVVRRSWNHKGGKAARRFRIMISEPLVRGLAGEAVAILPSEQGCDSGAMLDYSPFRLPIDQCTRTQPAMTPTAKPASMASGEWRAASGW